MLCGQLSQEEDLKAALLVSFVRFTSWPAGSSPDAPIVIGVVGLPELQQSIFKMANGKQAQGRPIQVRGVRYPADVRQCHLVYYGALSGRKLDELLEPARGLTMLTIGESDKFLDAGGVVQIFQEDGRLSFEVRMPTLQKSNLPVSSKLLRLGYTSGQGRGGGRVRP